MSFLTVADHDLGAFPFIALAPAVIAVAIAGVTVHRHSSAGSAEADRAPGS